MIFIRFAESIDLSDKWYETAEGKQQCDENTIDKLWWYWVSSLNARRTDTKKYSVFEFIKPVELDLDVLGGTPDKSNEI